MKRPNIVFVNVDQMHFQALSAYGNKDVNTPNLDKIVDEGYSFMESYCSMPQCCPARASWLTGRMSTESGVVVNRYSLDPEIPDLGQWLRKHAGYETVYTGKWHIFGRDVNDGFKVLPLDVKGKKSDSVISREAVGFIENYDGDKPFLLIAGLINPHDCCHIAKTEKFELDEKIEDSLPPLPENFDLSKRDAFQKGQKQWTQQDWRYYIYYYYRLVEKVDKEIGLIYNALRDSKHADNTLFIFSSDHGDGLGFHANVSKGFLKDEAWRTPTIVSWPGRIPAGQRDTEHLVSSVDLAATICDYAQVPDLPKTTIARSWRPLLEDEEVQWREYVVGETSVGRLSATVRDKRYKTIFFQDETNLYDIANDPLEMVDLAQSIEHEDIIKEHRNHFREYLREIEFCHTPSLGQEYWHRGDLYSKYIKWYEEFLAEAPAELAADA